LRYYLLLLFVVITHENFAQTSSLGSPSKIYRDTLNLSGVVLHSNGKPAKNVFISRPFYECYPNYKITTITDSLGKFHLNGLRIKDTLEIQATNFSQQIINNGSRTLRIILPAESKVVINQPVKIQAAELSKKKATHIVQNNEDCGGEYLYHIPELQAEFPGGQMSLQKFIVDNLIYPEESLRNNIEGEVIIQFQISPDGTPNDFRITSGLNKECDEAALKVINEMPKWRPAILYRPVSSNQSLTVEFSIKR